MGRRFPDSVITRVPILTPTIITIYGLATLLSLTAVVALVLLWKVANGKQHSDRLKRDLLKQQRYLQALVDALPFPVTAKDREGTFLLTNLASQRELGIDAQALGKTSLMLPSRGLLLDRNGQPTNGRFHQSSLDASTAGEEHQQEVSYIDGENSARIGRWSDRPIHLDDLGIVGSLGVLQDITEFRRIETETRVAEQSLREIASRIPIIVFTVHQMPDQTRRLAFLAGDLRALINVDPKDLIDTKDIIRDWPILEAIHPEDRDNVRKLIGQPNRREQTSALDFRAYGTKGLHWIHLTMGRRKLVDGGVHWTGYLIDTTSINLNNEALRAARDAAERGSKAKADFLATMSHEIRTPMSGVVGMLELLNHTQLDAEQKELIHAAEDSAGVLLQILNDVLDFSKLEAGNLRLDETPFDLRTLVDNIVSSTSASMHRAGLRVQVSVDAAVAGMLNGDSVRIRQILLNLLNNASKFTERGGVTVGAQVLGDDGVSQRISLTVADTGIGIAAEKRAFLFTPFAQAESWTTRRYGGTGLGLAICRHLVQLMDGSIRLDSKLGAGTTVTVNLQLRIDRREVDRPPGVAGHHAIVRVGSSETAEALSTYLLALGMTVERIPPSLPLRSGLSANLLFVDPNDDASPGAVAAQTIVVDADSVSRSGPFVQGESIHLNANPLKWKSVTRVCVMALAPLNPQPRTFSKTTESANTAALAMLGSGRGRLLVAEDHPVTQALVRRQCALLGWSCDIVGDGVAALEALARGGYVLLLTDCQMPRMDGYALTETWRKREAERDDNMHLPIIAMTASASDGEIARCQAAGMDDYLGKPVQLRELRQMIETWAPAESPATPEASSSSAAETVSTGTLRGLLDPEMLRIMVETGRADLDQLDRAVASADLPEAERRLHRMLGALELFTDSPEIAEGRRWLEELRVGHTGEISTLPRYLRDLRRLVDSLAASN